MKKLIKRLFFILAGLMAALSLGIVICALNPSLTRKLAGQVQAMSEGGDVEEPQEDKALESQARGEGKLAQAIPGINVDWLPNREEEGYLVPEQMPQTLPEEVQGLGGFEPVKVDSQQVLPEEAENLEGVLSEELKEAEFLMLEPDLQTLYRQIYSAYLQTAVSLVPAVEVKLDELETVFEALFNDHPELAYIDTGYYCLYLEDGTCAEVSLVYNELINDLQPALDLLTQRENEIMDVGNSLDSDFERVRYVHDLLAELVEYDRDAPLNQSAYSGLVSRRTVCAGYARAFQLLLQDMGIPCYYCTGFTGEDHAWNIVLLDGKYYNVDVTWDDREPLSYEYFNRTDAEFAATHVRTGLSVYLPACTGTYYGGQALESPGTEADVSDGDQALEGSGTEADVSDGDQAQGTPAPEGQTPPPQPQESAPALEHPLTWEDDSDEGNDAESQTEQTPAPVVSEGEKALDTLEEYYDDCEARMMELGVGERQFDNVVPASLWGLVESAYSSGAYWDGYVADTLKAMGAEKFHLHIQVQNLGGGYYRIRHNVTTE